MQWPSSGDAVITQLPSVLAQYCSCFSQRKFLSRPCLPKGGLSWTPCSVALTTGERFPLTDRSHKQFLVF